jgi:hypothetical protein
MSDSSSVVSTVSSVGKNGVVGYFEWLFLCG